MSFYGKTLSKIEKAFSAIKFKNLSSPEKEEFLVTAKNNRDAFNIQSDGFTFSEFTSEDGMPGIKLFNDSVPMIKDLIGTDENDYNKSVREITREEANKIIQGGIFQSNSILVGAVKKDPETQENILELDIKERIKQ